MQRNNSAFFSLVTALPVLLSLGLSGCAAQPLIVETTEANVKTTMSAGSPQSKTSFDALGSYQVFKYRLQSHKHAVLHVISTVPDENLNKRYGLAFLQPKNLGLACVATVTPTKGSSDKHLECAIQSKGFIEVLRVGLIDGELCRILRTQGYRGIDDSIVTPTECTAESHTKCVCYRIQLCENIGKCDVRAKDYIPKWMVKPFAPPDPGSGSGGSN